jgi:hypothetical protein
MSANWFRTVAASAIWTAASRAWLTNVAPIFDEFLLQGRQRPVLDRHRRRHPFYSGLLALAANILVAILVNAVLRFSSRGDR